MSIEAGALVGIRRRLGSRVRDLALATIAAVAVAALILAVVAIRSDARPVTISRPAANAQWIYQRSAPVTGTGPDLVQVARGARATTP